MSYKLSSSQKTFIHNIFNPMWNQGVIYFFENRYNYKQLNEAINSLVKMFDALRLCSSGGNSLFSANYTSREYPLYSFINMEELNSFAKDFINKPFFKNELLTRFVIFEVQEQVGIISCAHHLSIDGFSGALAIKYINDYLKGSNADNVLRQSYTEFIEKEEKYKLTKRYIADKKFWSKQFDSSPDCSLYESKHISVDYASDEFNFILDKSLFYEIKRFCNSKEISVQAFFNTVYSIYIYKTLNLNFFTLGVPVLNRTTEVEYNSGGLYMHIVPLVVKMSDNSFLQNLVEIEDAQLTLFRHQKFTQHDIKELLKEENRPQNTLFDIATDYQEFEKNEDYDFEFIYSNALSLPLEIHVQSFGEEKHNLKIRYRTSMFSEKEIQIMMNSFISIIQDALENPDKKISELNMMPEEEKYKIIRDFNNTASDYPKDKCIHELFEEQVEKTPDQIAVVAADKTLTYKELNEEANKIAHSLIEKGIGKGDIVALMLPRKSYLLSALFGVLKTGAAYLPVDSESPKDRVEYILSDSNAKFCITPNNIEQLLGNKNAQNLNTTTDSSCTCYCIYTSGSTGTPKGAKVSHKSAVNRILWMHDKYPLGKDDVILQKTPYTFDVSVWELFWWSIVGGKLALSKPGEHFLSAKILEETYNNKVTHLHFVPSVFGLFLNYLETHQDELYKFNSVRYVFVSGEALTASLVQRFYALFSYEKVTLHNLYGPTECAVDVTYYDCKPDDIDPVPIGEPIYNTQIYILDKHGNLAPLGVTGELCIAGDNVGQGYLNRPELTAEKFIDNPFGEGKMYRTGDLAYWREDGNIVFVGRNDFQVKIRGLRIELGEIENALQAVSGINRAVVVVRKDRNDRQLICAFYTGQEISAKNLREVLSKNLPKYMVPHIFTHLENMPMTSSGKANRNALPEIDLENISTETEYIAPSTKEEILLVECICDVLGTEKVSVLDNFFDIGGDSLKSIELTAKLEEKGYTVAIKTIFSCKDIQELASKLQKKQDEEASAEYGSVIPATAAQMRVYTAQMLKPDSTMYNVTYGFRTENVDKVQLEKAINKLIERHESLRTHFENRDGQIVQVIDENVGITVEEISEDQINNFTKPFDLSKSPLVRVGCSKETVLISLHHISVDGESLPVFFKELNELYSGRMLTKTPVQYGEFSVTDKFSEDNEKYWLDIFKDEIPTLELPYNHPRGAVQSFEGDNIYERIDKSLHEKIEYKCKERGITPYVYYMACLSILLSKLSGNEDIVTGTPISGRQSKYLNTIGMFVNTIALRSRPEGNKTVAELFEEIKLSSIDAIDNQSYPFGELIKKLNTTSAGRNPLFDVMFAYQSFEMTDITFADIKAEILPLKTKTAKCDITLSIMPRKDDVVLSAEYCTALFEESRIRTFIDMYTLLLELCLDDDKYIKDISVADMKLIDSFNATASDYPKDKCIHELFEEQVEKTPDQIAVVAADKTLTYKELNEEANKIAHSLIEKGIGKGDIVALMLPRKSYLLSALFGVLKTGAAYLPFDPEYPTERINIILFDSGSKLCISEENINDLLKNTNTENLTNMATINDFCYCIYTSGSTGSPKGTLLYHRNLVWYMSVLKNLYGTDNVNMPFFTSQSVDLTVPSIYLPLLTGGTSYLYNGELKDTLIDIFNNDNLTLIKFTPTHMGIINNLVPDKLCSNIRCIIVGGESLYKETCTEFLNKFGNHIEIHNEYGPTETTVSCTDYIFSLDADTDSAYLPIGRPVSNAQIYITDKYMQAVPIGVTGELCIAGDGVGAGYLNSIDLTNEKFIDNPFGNGKLYKTGDLARWTKDGNIVFMGRKDFQVKIRGLRIELGEIESTLQEIETIDRAVAVVRKDITDRELICAFYTGTELSATAIRESIGKKLPNYMIPHSFTHLQEMPLTSSGKINRTALPEIDLENISTQAEYIAPETQKEIALSEALCSVLELDSVSMQENFFNIGGDSIKAIYIVSELEEKGYELHVSDIMQQDLLSEVAELMKPTSYKAIYEQGEVNGFLPFTPIMRAFLNDSDTIPKDYIHSCVIPLDCDKYTARKALDALVSHHDILRGSFCENGIEILPCGKKDIYSFEAITVFDKKQAIERLNNIKISDDKLINVVFCATSDENLISITIHHFLIDLVSWEILIKDFQLLVEHLKTNTEIALPDKTASFKMWSEELEKYSETITEETKTYWENIGNRLDNTKSIHPYNEIKNDAETYNFTFDESISAKIINEVNITYGTRANEVLLTALGLAAGKLADGSVGIIVESHGRTELNKPIAIERTVGWFTSCYPVVIDSSENITDVLIDTKETLRRIPKNGIDYLILSQGFHKNLNIKFNFYKSNATNEESKQKLLSFNSDTSVFPGKINVNCFIVDNILSVNVSVPKCVHKQGICEELGVEFINQVEKLVDICTKDNTVIKTRSDFSDDDLTETELNELKDLFDWTDNYEQ